MHLMVDIEQKNTFPSDWPTFEEVPNQGYYFSRLSAPGRAAIARVEENPESITLLGSWSLTSLRQKAVPMLWVQSKGTNINIDARNPVAQRIFEANFPTLVDR